jgi:hypothetical protein
MMARYFVKCDEILGPAKRGSVISYVGNRRTISVSRGGAGSASAGVAWLQVFLMKISISIWKFRFWSLGQVVAA